MAAFKDWRERLTPYDTELCMMVESLTGKPCEPRALNDGRYFITVDYSDHKDTVFINAVMDAIAGRLGERLVGFDDYPEESRFLATVQFSSETYPRIMRLKVDCNPKPYFGVKYADFRPGMPEGAWVLAVQVNRETASRMLSFVGSGEFEIPGDAPATFHFINSCAGGLWQHAAEGDYVVYIDGQRMFIVIDRETFETNFEVWKTQS